MNSKVYESHAAVLYVVELNGYATSVHRMGDYCEVHAVPRPSSGDVKIARVEGDGPEDVFLAACLLAEMCGVDLEG